ncbi:MAG: hypothetical protein V9H26_17270 [Verrucomicrobiota bacterium]|nr:hypothetical protein [Verrucomicrobiota bacterium]MCC6823703.1 hypothetical protein [Limisphaerales bacterium]
MSTANIKELESQLVQIKARLQSMFGKGSGSLEAISSVFDEQHELERKLAAVKGEAYAKPIDIGCVPSVSGSGETFIQAELSDAFIIFGAVAKTKESGGRYDDIGWAFVRLKHCQQSKFGYPNDEAFPGHPLYGKGFSGVGVFEVINSNWEQILREQNRISFPDSPPWPWELKHLIFAFKENVLECLVKDFEARIENRPFAELLAEATAKIVRD